MKMVISPIKWLTRASWRKLAPDDAYLSCEYSLESLLEETVVLTCGWQIMMYGVS